MIGKSASSSIQLLSENVQTCLVAKILLPLVCEVRCEIMAFVFLILLGINKPGYNLYKFHSLAISNPLHSAEISDVSHHDTTVVRDSSCNYFYHSGLYEYCPLVIIMLWF